MHCALIIFLFIKIYLMHAEQNYTCRNKKKSQYQKAVEGPTFYPGKKLFRRSGNFSFFRFCSETKRLFNKSSNVRGVLPLEKSRCGTLRVVHHLPLSAAATQFHPRKIIPSVSPALSEIESIVRSWFVLFLCRNAFADGWFPGDVFREGRKEFCFRNLLFNQFHSPPILLTLLPNALWNFFVLINDATNI